MYFTMYLCTKVYEGPLFWPTLYLLKNNVEFGQDQEEVNGGSKIMSTPNNTSVCYATSKCNLL
jgi:hypothetical protein